MWKSEREGGREGVREEGESEGGSDGDKSCSGGTQTSYCLLDRRSTH